MAEAPRESEPPKTRASKRLEVKAEASKVAESSSTGTSEGKSDTSSRMTRSGESSQESSATSVSKKSESVSSASPKPPTPSKTGAVPKASVQSKKKAVSRDPSPVEKDAVPKGTSPSKTRTSPKATVSGIFGSFAKWASPPKKTKTPKKKTAKGSGSSAESDESPDKKDRPATVSSRKKIKETIKSVGSILFSSSSKSSKPSTIEEVCLVQPEAESRHEEFKPSGIQSEIFSKFDPETWEPKNVEVTGQINFNLRGELMASYETLHPLRTDTSSLSDSVSAEVERASSLPLDSREGSIEGSSSLEKEFEGLASPSKSIQGLKRFQDPIQEEEEEDAMGCSPRKVRLMSPDKDPTEKPSDVEMN